MKKIGLAVCYDTKNFGSQLQVLATVKKIEELGFRTEIIRYKKKLTMAFVIQSLPRLFNVAFIKSKLCKINKKIVIKVHSDIAKKISKRNQRFEGFAIQHFDNLSEMFIGWENLVNGVADKYDAFLCGSDQLWLPHNLESHFYTLEFAPDNKPKIAYATSFGVEHIPWYQKKRTAQYLQRLQFISTREFAGQKIIEGVIGRKVDVVCDPTFFFSEENWDILIPHKEIISEPYIFCYFLGINRAHRQAALTLKQKNGLKIVTCPLLDSFMEEDLHFGDEKLFDVDSDDFVNLIRNAEYVLTDSFHGTVFSILNHKKFLIFDRFAKGSNSRNSRIDSLCELLSLQDRRYKGDITYVEKSVDYKMVDIKINEYREASIRFLKNALNNI